MLIALTELLSFRDKTIQFLQGLNNLQVRIQKPSDFVLIDLQ